MSHEPLEPLSPDLQALLRSERQREPVAPDVSARIKSHVATSVGAPSVPPPAPPSGGVDATGAFGLSTKLPIVVAAFVLGGLSGAALTWTLMPRQSVVTQGADPVAKAEPAPTPATLTPPIAGAPGLDPPVAAAEPVKESDPTHVPDAGAQVPVHDPDRDLAAERNLMEQARSSLAHSRWNDALLSLDKHRSRFSRGKLAEERDSMRVPTLVMLGRYDDARAAAQRFHARYPTSIFASGVDQAVRSIP